MKCIKCGHTMKPEAPRTLVADVRGERLEVQVVVPQCSHCGRVVLGGKGRRAYHRAASDAYRRKHGLLMTQEFDQLRRSLGMTWKQFAEYVNVGIATLKRWMGGEIQTSSLDLLVRLKADPTFAQRALEELLARLVADAANMLTVESVTPRRGTTSSVRFAAPEMAAADTQLELAA